MERKERLTLDTVDGAAPPPDASPPVAEPVLDGIPSPRGTESPPAQDPTGTRPAPDAPSPASRPRARSLRALLPTPVGIPFTFVYVTVLLITSAVTEYADPSLVHTLHQGSSTDVAHLVQQPVLVLVASALWIAGGIGSPYTLGLVVVLAALERRLGGPRTAGVFLLGHVLATLATEVPVGLAVLVGGVLVHDLIAFQDPMTNWGHLIALAIGVAVWPVVRSRHGAGTGTGLRPAQA